MTMKYYHNTATNQIYAYEPFYIVTDPDFIELTPQQIAWWKDKPRITWGRLDPVTNEIVEYPVNFGVPVIDSPPTASDFHTVTPVGFEIDQDGVYVRQYELTPIPLEDAKALLKEKVTAKRWEVETGGIIVNGDLVLTSIEDQNRVANAVSLAGLSGVTHVDFKNSKGEWLKNIPIQALESIAAAIGQHVQNCFSIECLKHEEIDLLTSIQECIDYRVDDGWE